MSKIQPVVQSLDVNPIHPLLKSERSQKVIEMLKDKPFASSSSITQKISGGVQNNRIKLPVLQENTHSNEIKLVEEFDLIEKKIVFCQKLEGDTGLVETLGKDVVDKIHEESTNLVMDKILCFKGEFSENELQNIQNLWEKVKTIPSLYQTCKKDGRYFLVLSQIRLVKNDLKSINIKNRTPSGCYKKKSSLQIVRVKPSRFTKPNVQILKLSNKIGDTLFDELSWKNAITSLKNSETLSCEVKVINDEHFCFPVAKKTRWAITRFFIGLFLGKAYRKCEMEKVQNIAAFLIQNMRQIDNQEDVETLKFAIKLHQLVAGNSSLKEAVGNDSFIEFQEKLASKVLNYLDVEISIPDSDNRRRLEDVLSVREFINQNHSLRKQCWKDPLNRLPCISSGMQGIENRLEMIEKNNNKIKAIETLHQELSEVVEEVSNYSDALELFYKEYCLLGVSEKEKEIFHVFLDSYKEINLQMHTFLNKFSEFLENGKVDSINEKDLDPLAAGTVLFFAENFQFVIPLIKNMMFQQRAFTHLLESPLIRRNQKLKQNFWDRINPIFRFKLEIKLIRKDQIFDPVINFTPTLPFVKYYHTYALPFGELQTLLDKGTPDYLKVKKGIASLFNHELKKS